MPGKTLTIFLTAAPYAGEHASTAMRLTKAALEAGHRVNLFASADGVYAFTAGHRAKGLPNAEAGFRQLIDQKLHVSPSSLRSARRTARATEQKNILTFGHNRIIIRV